MKLIKIFSGVTAIAVTAACLSFAAFAETDTSGKFVYEVLDDDTVCITGYTGTDENLVIPNTIDDMPVTMIGERALSNADFITVKIPDTVTTIGVFAFGGCISLTKVEIPDSVTTIEGGAFRYCYSLDGIELPDGLTTIEYNAFDNCTSLSKIEIPDSVTHIGDGAFSVCTSLASITVSKNNPNYASIEGVLFNKDVSLLIQYPCGSTVAKYAIPNGVATIRANSFGSSTYLEEVVIPDSVKEIGLNSTGGLAAFSDCAALTTITVDEKNANYSSVGGVLLDKSGTTLIQYPTGRKAAEYTVPDNITTIEGNALCDGTYLEKIVFSDSVTTIGHHAFSGCKSLTEIIWGKGMKEIEDNAFMGCHSLTEINFPNSLTTIGNYVFGGCRTLTKVVIPNSVTDLGSSAFYLCPSLVDVTLPDSITTINSLTFAFDESLAEIIIPDSVTAIGGNAFWECTSLVKIVIPDSVKEIADNAFQDCSDGLTIYGYIGSYAETYAKEHEINFADIEEEPVVTEPETTTTPETQPEVTTTTAKSENTTTAPTENLIGEDKATGVQLLAADGVISEGTQLNVKIGSADITIDAHIYVLDITLVNAQGATVQPNGSVTVKIPLPEGFEDSGTYYVYYQDDDGKLTDMHATFTSDGYVTFTTTHFSTYILSPEKLSDDAIPNTGVVLLIIPALAAAAGIVISRKRK